MADKYEYLMTYETYARFKGVTQQCVRYWVETGKVKREDVQGRNYVHLTPDEIKERKEKGI